MLELVREDEECSIAEFIKENFCEIFQLFFCKFLEFEELISFEIIYSFTRLYKNRIEATIPEEKLALVINGIHKKIHQNLEI